MKPNSQTRLYGLIGHPLKHSLSPIMHNAVFKELGINAVYLCFDIKPGDLLTTVKGMRGLNISGFNVTIPYKEMVLGLVDKVCNNPGFAQTIGALNTIKTSQDKLYGYNTDGIGFIAALKKLGFNPLKKKVLILGAGGAGKALAVTLTSKNISFLQIYDVDYKRSFALESKIKRKFGCVVTAIKDRKKVDIQNVDLVINASPVGMHRNDPLSIPSYLLKKNLFVYDLVYNPEGRRITKLIEIARKKGCLAYDGIWMLVYQGIEALKIWFGDKIKQEEVSSIIFKALKREGITIN